MARQPKKESKEYWVCPECNSTFLDVTIIYNNTSIYGKEYDCRNCTYAWDDKGNKL